jgi:hypothetical protein
MINKYQDVKVIEKDKAEQIFLTNNVENICSALVSISFYEKDWKWAQDKCLEFLINNNVIIAGLAAICLGHIARIHGKIEKDRVINALKHNLSNKELAGQIQDALDDIELYIGNGHRPSSP